jgi:hypothetical protein
MGTLGPAKRIHIPYFKVLLAAARVFKGLT